MKRIAVGIAAALMLVSATAGPALAANEQSGKTVITASVDSGYTLTVPANTTISFNAVKTKLAGDLTVRGNITDSQKVTVTATTGAFASSTSGAAIPYALQREDGTAFASETWTAAEVNGGTKELDLVVNIAKEAWDAAGAGQYSGTITFKAELE